MALEGEQLPAGRQVPYLHRPVGARRRQAPSRRVVRDGADAPPVAVQLEHLPAGVDIPYRHHTGPGGVEEGAAAGRQVSAVRGEGHTEHTRLRAVETNALLLLGGVPHLHRSVRAAGNEAFAVGAEGDAVDLVQMPLVLLEFLAGLYIPYLHQAVAARRGEPSAVRVEGEGGHEPLVPRQRVQLPAGARIPQLDDPFARAGR